MATAKKPATTKTPTVAQLAKRLDTLEAKMAEQHKGVDMGAIEAKVKDLIKDANVGERYNKVFENIGPLNKAQQWVAANPHYAIGIIVVLAILWLVNS